MRPHAPQLEAAHEVSHFFMHEKRISVAFEKKVSPEDASSNLRPSCKNR